MPAHPGKLKDPAPATRKPGATLRHNLPGGDHGHLARMAAEVTAAHAGLRPGTAPGDIDRALSTPLRTSRPIHLTIPADVAGAQPHHLIVSRWGDSACIS
jgi:TPP-dependent 2-oxoacid decarboxylase